MNIQDILEIDGLESLKKLEKLSLSDNQIKNISGLDELTNLKELYLNNNIITEISGLNNLINLEHLDLRYNQISDIKGFENLEKLEWLYVSGQKNNAPREIVQKLGGLSSVGYALKPQEFVSYSRKIRTKNKK